MHILQVFSAFVDDLLTVDRLWKRGCPDGVTDDLSKAVDGVISSLRTLASWLGFSPLFPKSHDLLHVVRDIAFFGPSWCLSTGACLSESIGSDITEMLCEFHHRDVRNQAQRTEEVFQVFGGCFW